MMLGDFLWSNTSNYVHELVPGRVLDLVGEFRGKGSAAVRQPAVGPLTGGPACVGPTCQGHHCRALNCSGSRSEFSRGKDSSSGLGRTGQTGRVDRSDRCESGWEGLISGS